MLTNLLYSNAVLALALGFLLLAVAGPFLLLWAALSIRRNLARIADALEQTTTPSGETSCRRAETPQPVVVDHERRVLNSIFGR